MGKIKDAFDYGFLKYSLLVILIVVTMLMLCALVVCGICLARHIVTFLASLGASGSTIVLIIAIYAIVDEVEALKRTTDG